MAEQKDSYISSDVADVTPLGLLHALSLIEQYAEAEKQSSLSKKILTPKSLSSFFSVGFKASIVSGLVTALLSPMMFAVHMGLIPVFGDYQLTFFDSFFMVFITTSFSLGISFFVFFICARAYSGSVTKRAIHLLVGGLFSGAFFLSIVIFILYHILYYQYLTPEGIAYAFNFFPKFLRPDYRTAYWIFKFSEELIPGAYFQFAVSVSAMFVVGMSVIFGRIRSNKISVEREKWK